MERTFSADDAGFDDGDAQRRQRQHKRRQHDQRHGIADRRHPRCAQRSQQEVGAAEDKICNRERAPESHAIGKRAAEDREKPDEAAEKSGKRAGSLGGEAQGLVQVTRERGERRVVGEPLEEFADVGDPEGPFETGTDIVAALGQGHGWLPVAGSPLSGFSYRTTQPFFHRRG